jgi:YebC/PmpR family DNA-binding regulatory protein
MSGHSKWSTIKRAKGVTDARRGQLFTKLTRDITIAVRQGGGGDPDMNYRLRLAIDKARGSNMPVDNIDRAVTRAAGGGDSGDNLVEAVYEGYGPGGIAIILEALTDNRNRTASEIRAAFAKSGGNLGETGCVGWNFETKGIISLDVDDSKAEEIAMMAIEAEADDVSIEDGYMEIFTQPESLESIRKALEAENVPTTSAEISMKPKTIVSLTVKQAEQTLRLLDNLEDLMDVQKVYSNADFPEEVLEKYQNEG